MAKFTNYLSKSLLPLSFFAATRPCLLPNVKKYAASPLRGRRISDAGGNAAETAGGNDWRRKALAVRALRTLGTLRSLKSFAKLLGKAAVSGRLPGETGPLIGLTSRRMAFPVRRIVMLLPVRLRIFRRSRPFSTLFLRSGLSKKITIPTLRSGMAAARGTARRFLRTRTTTATDVNASPATRRWR